MFALTFVRRNGTPLSPPYLIGVYEILRGRKLRVSFCDLKISKRVSVEEGGRFVLFYNKRVIGEGTVTSVVKL